MKKKLFLHIGASKTGSSAIQTFIKNNRVALKHNGFVVPDRQLGLSNRITGEHVFAFQELITNHTKDGLTLTVSALLAETAPDETLLISAENLSNIGNHRFFDTLGAKNDISVLIYIRRQDELLTSAWQQWHSKLESDFNAWLVLALRTYGQWARVIKAWESVVGEGNVTVRVFERDQFPDGDITKDFMTCLGLFPVAGEFSHVSENVNPSRSDIITPLVAGNRAIFRDANDQEFDQIIGRLTGKTYSSDLRVSLMTRGQREKIMEYFRPMNETVCRTYFPGKKRLFKPIDHSRYRYLSETELVGEQLRFLTECIYALAKRKETP